MLSDHLFEGDLPQSKSLESNILAASKKLVIESLAQMREGGRNEKGSSFVDDLLGDSKLIFDQTPEVGIHPSTNSSDTNEDNVPLRWWMSLTNFLKISLRKKTSPRLWHKRKKGKQVKSKGKSKSKTFSVNKAETTTKGKGKESQKKKEPSK
ncbi:hypothetical protein H5410_045311 [Solanum commersonii]|uniref:Uncharacterized protein n=1 Tax=Solanum commersonii TaxID=4109 RepID=A0A9J5XB98_SOLCO|nr:hypothetical protein H5410_045311 [Solanum commersonii]